MFGDFWSLQVDNQKNFISLLNVSVMFLIKLQVLFHGVLGKLKCAAIGINSLLRTSVPWSFILREQGS